MREVIGQIGLQDGRTMTAGSLPQSAGQQQHQTWHQGLEVIAFTVQSFPMKAVVITTRIENAETIKKDALIAKAKAERERKEVEAEQDKLVNDNRVAADLEIRANKTN